MALEEAAGGRNRTAGSCEDHSTVAGAGAACPASNGEDGAHPLRMRHGHLLMRLLQPWPLLARRAVQHAQQRRMGRRRCGREAHQLGVEEARRRSCLTDRRCTWHGHGKGVAIEMYMLVPMLYELGLHYGGQARAAYTIAARLSACFCDWIHPLPLLRHGPTGPPTELRQSPNRAVSQFCELHAKTETEKSKIIMQGRASHKSAGAISQARARTRSYNLNARRHSPHDSPTKLWSRADRAA